MIYQSARPAIELPDVTLTDFVLTKTGALRDKPALVDAASGRALSFGALEERVRATARGLAELGFGPGDVLALHSPNALEYAVAFHAAALAGGATTTINPAYTAEEVAQQLRDSGARLLVTAPELVERARAAAASAGITQLYALGDGGGLPALASLARAGGFEQVPVDARQALVALPYSSGTTGLPKGVMLTHRNLVANALQLGGSGHFQQGDVFVCVLPMFHIYGLAAILNLGLQLGATIHVVARFEFEALLRTLQDARVTLAHLVPPILIQLAKHPAVERYDLSKLRAIFSGAAPLSREITAACEQRLNLRILQGYGLTESSPATHVTPLDAARARPGTVGELLAGTECRLVDPQTGSDAARGQPGEIWVRGPQVMRGYLGCPEATRATVDAEGWLRTGDIGTVEAGTGDGPEQFAIVDRLKELIKYKGFQVAPAELEAVLLGHASVADAAVIPLADDEAGEVPKAFVVRKGPVGEAELLAYVAERVAPHKKLRALEFVDQIPKSPSGKILRRVLVERERARRA